MRKLEYNSVKLKPDPNIISLISIHKCRVQQRTDDTFARQQHVHGRSQSRGIHLLCVNSRIRRTTHLTRMKNRCLVSQSGVGHARKTMTRRE